MAALLLCALLFSGCDHLRAALGKPTSADLDAMRLELVRMRERHIQDSLAQAQALADSLAAAADSLASAVFPEASQADTTAIISKKDLTKRYYVIAGCFSTPEAALKFSRTISSAGCSTVQAFKLREERFAVSCFGGSTFQEAEEAMAQLCEKDICPADAWIYKNDK